MKPSNSSSTRLRGSIAVSGTFVGGVGSDAAGVETGGSAVGVASVCVTSAGGERGSSGARPLSLALLLK